MQTRSDFFTHQHVSLMQSVQQIPESSGNHYFPGGQAQKIHVLLSGSTQPSFLFFLLCPFLANCCHIRFRFRPRWAVVRRRSGHRPPRDAWSGASAGTGTRQGLLPHCHVVFVSAFFWRGRWNKNSKKKKKEAKGVEKAKELLTEASMKRSLQCLGPLCPPGG